MRKKESLLETQDDHLQGRALWCGCGQGSMCLLAAAVRTVGMLQNTCNAAFLASLGGSSKLFGLECVGKLHMPRGGARGAPTSFYLSQGMASSLSSRLLYLPNRPPPHRSLIFIPQSCLTAVVVEFVYKKSSLWISLPATTSQ